MGLFKKKLSDEELIQSNIAAQQAEITGSSDSNKDENSLGDTKLAVEVTKIQAQLEGLNEQRKAVNERFSHISEEIGEMRGMIVETNKAVSRIEAASTKAIDMVESVKPDQLMIEVRKGDLKIEALRASVEGNQNMMADIMKEVKAMRKQMNFYKGVEQIAKMNDEIKKELIDIKKIEAVIDRHSNKVESIFIDVEKKYAELDKFTDITKELSRNFGKVQGDVDKLRVKVEDAAGKSELVKLIGKFNDFEKHTSNILSLLEDKTKSSSEEINTKFGKLENKMYNKIDSAIRKLSIATDKAYKSEQEESVEASETKSEEKSSNINERKKSFFGFFKKPTQEKSSN